MAKHPSRTVSRMLDGPEPPAAPSTFGPGPLRLGRSEQAVLAAMVESPGRVIGRLELARRAGLRELSERRIDAVMVTLRRALSGEAIRTVRRRGWMLESGYVDAAVELLATASIVGE
jgi:DNA-binding winged helix-turn-helix (wHTH) protein